jgi:catechol 2,3-dioxygenase-like lactoylglutathione lyase family enzyme
VPRVEATAFFPVLITDRLPECRDFYVRHFGFDVVFEADWYVQLMSEKRIQLGLMKPDHASQPELLQRGYEGHGVVYSFEVDDVDREYEKLKDDDVEIVFDIRTEPWGQRHFMILDPAGMVVDVAQLAEPAAEFKASYVGG